MIKHKPNYVFWWNIPCKGMIHLLKEVCSEILPGSITVTGPVDSQRKSMGWDEVKPLFPSHFILKPEKWIEETTEFFDNHRDYIHVFNGITTKYFYHLSKRAKHEGIPYIYMTEAYSNLASGWRRQLKDIYIKKLLPFRTASLAKNAMGVINLSGKREFELRQFERLGFQKNRIIPFGYWTDSEPIRHSPRNDKRLSLLCPGILEWYKGVDILIKAIALCISNGTDKIICHITGRGSRENELKQLVKSLHVDEYVRFHSALSETEYSNLLKEIDVLVAPGRFEPWGIRINEAIQWGIVTVVSDGLGASHLVEESGAGIVFPSGDYQNLSRSICKLANMTGSELHSIKQKSIDYSGKISCRTKAIELVRHLDYLNSLND
ncbi:MAG: glycosyltransferase family 4 protein [Muribaculaceae bacterium]|nr:glycosyltransferase family 4 protein [Muribaculaceae bacterium]